MAKQGEVLVNPFNKDSIEFVETSSSTNGEYVKLKHIQFSKGQQVPDHLHVYQNEVFEVISGTLTIEFENKIIELKAGEKIELPKNKPHNHYNLNSDRVEYFQSVSPALDFEYLIENIAGLTADGKANNGSFGLVQELVTLKYIGSKAYLASIPIGVQQLMMNIVAPVARLFGYRAVYKKYSGIEI
ncbi:MAG: cupin domain-containing protein [Cytophagales bacterium]